MTPERWQQIEQISQEALEREPAERAAFLDKVCGGDGELRREIESLLVFVERADNFIEAPPGRMAADWLAAKESRDGQTIGHYQLIRQLGRGGMGEVYLARDARLGRQVAVKLLQANFTQDAARVRRFQLEARAASALNHPNILTIYEVGQDDPTAGGAHFIAAEFVDGQTLRELCRGKGLALGAALDILIQVAGALTTAHEAGIVHRDIKPENIMVRGDGLVKVLDFGLAKLIEQATRPHNVANVSFARVTTQPGLVMGTISYMSPEQARGLEVDERSDLFSLGVVMYELLTGCAPFSGETTSDVLVALLSVEPRPLARYVAGLPAALQEIVNRALAKEVEQRYQTAREIGDEIKRLKQDLEFASRDPALATQHKNAIAMKVGSASQSAPDYNTMADYATLADGRPAVDDAARDNDNPARDYATRADHNAARRATAPMATLLSFLRRRGKVVLLMPGALALVIVAAVSGLWRRAPQNGAIDSIAVLPFANVGADPQMEYLPDGITENLIDSLSRLPRLTVMARSTVFTYKGREVDPRQIGAALKVRAVVTGRVERRSERLFIHAELVEASNGARLWGERYNCSIADLPAVQDNITRGVSAALRLRLSGDQQKQIAKRQTGDSEAYRLYLLGNHLYYQHTRESQEKALDYFNQAVSLDPTYALAYAGIARVYATFSAQHLSPGEAMPKARQAALKAIELDETLPEAHYSMGLIKWWGEWDWAAAEREFNRAIELNSNFVNGRVAYADLMVQRGRFEEAAREIQMVKELDPLSAHVNASEGMVFYLSRRYDQAIAQNRKTLELYPSNAATHRAQGIIFSLQGRHQEAINELRQALALNSHYTYQAWAAYVYARAGQRAEALKILRDLEEQANSNRVSPVYIARIHVGLRENDRAFEWLRKAYEERSDHLLSIGVDPVYDPLRSDPRYLELLRDIGLAL